MNGALLIVTALCLYAQNIFRKNFTQVNEDTAFGQNSFNFLVSFSALVFFDVMRRLIGEPFHLHGGTILLAAVFALSFVICLYTMGRSMETGPLGLTSLIISYSLIIPTAYGLIRFKESLTWLLSVGLLLLFVSLYLVKPVDKKRTIGKGWVLFVSVAAVTNGLCSVVQTEQQHLFSVTYRFAMLEWSMIFSCVFSAALVLATYPRFRYKKESGNKGCRFKGMYNAPICGLANGSLNYLVITLAGRLPASLLFPIVSAGSLILTMFSSVVFYREKYSPKQYIGFVLGVLSIVFMNL